MIKILENRLYEDLSSSIFEDILRALMYQVGVQEGKKVIIKPNLCYDKNVKLACTRKELITPICKVVSTLTCDWSIVESNVHGGKATPLQVATLCEYPSLVIDKLVNITTNPEVLEDYDFLINVPKLKAHDFLRYTCARKNLFGFVPTPEIRLKAHSEGLLEKIEEVNKQHHSNLVVVDAIECMEGKGSPLYGTSKRLNMIITGDSSEEVDAWVEENIIDKGLLQYEHQGFGEFLAKVAGKSKLTTKVYWRLAHH